MSPRAADLMAEAMIGVVEGGSGANAQLAGFVVGGKTGTAQVILNVVDHRMSLADAMAAPDESPPTAFTADDLTHVGFGGLFRLNGRVAPKVTVALGLLRRSNLTYINAGLYTPRMVPGV